MSSMGTASGDTGSSQGPCCMFQGLDFPAWLRLLARRPKMEWAYALRIAGVTAFSLSNSFWGFAEKLLYDRRIRAHKIEQPPVFILGHWRSGTTLLHNLMSLDKQFVCPNLYQVLNPQHFLLTENVISSLTAWALPKTRPMDNIPVSWGMPQEDEIALMNLTLSSQYLQCAFNARPEEYNQYLRFEGVAPEVVERWKEAMVWFMKRVTLKKPGRLLLKSPTHTFKVALLRELYPDAKFVHIVRNPYAVYTSSGFLRQKMYEGNAFATPDLSYNAVDLLNAMEFCFDVLAEDRKSIPAGHFCEMKFESLERDPLGELSRVYDELGLSGYDGLKAAILPQLDDIRKFRKNQYSPLPEETKRTVYERLSHVFEQYGYTSDLADSTPRETIRTVAPVKEAALVA